MYLFYKSIMHILIVNVILFYGIYANYIPDSNSLNVGSVLFNRNNLNKSLWYKYEIELLDARKYLQNILPSPHHIKTINEDSLNHIMDYFKDSYMTIKHEAPNNHLQNIMNIAISDVFGGYLKVWILPITKYAYYGGSVSMDKALSMFQIYDKLKSNLNTDGNDWRSPNENILRSVTIDVVSRPHTTFTRSMGDPCKPLTFYEKTDTDFKIPMPIVNWNIQPPSLVLPFKSKSCISLTSPDSSHIVLQYLDIAENCMKSQNVQKLDEFNERFQIWLSSDVVPHLHDENLYLAFGNILSVVNKTKEIGRKICTNYNEKYEKLKYKASAMKSHGQLLLKKYFIVGIILLIEIIWCIPSIYYVIRFKRKNRFQRARERFYRFFKRKPTYSLHHFSQYNCENNNFQSYESGLKLFFKRDERNVEVDAPFSFHDSELLSNETQRKTTSYENITLTNEVPKKNSSKKQYKVACISVQDSINVDKSPKKTQDVLIGTSSMKKRNKESPSCSLKHSTSVPKDEQTINEINYSQVSSPKKSSSALKCTCCMTNEKLSKNPKLQCPCVTCTTIKNNENETLIDINKKPKPKYFKFRQNDNKKKCKTITTLHTNQKTHFQTRIVKTTKNSEGPHLHINAKKRPEIKNEVMNIKETAGSSRTPSKIPRLKIKSDLREMNNDIINKCGKNPTKRIDVCAARSILQNNNFKPNDKVLDDSAIKRDSSVTKKLNTSL